MHDFGYVQALEIDVETYESLTVWFGECAESVFRSSRVTVVDATSWLSPVLVSHGCGTVHRQWLSPCALIGHGGAALKVFVGLSVQQNQQLEHMGQLEAPRGRRGEFYWPLKSQAETALESGANRASGSGRVQDVVLRPLTVTYVGLREMLQNGTLYACDGEQWRLYAPLRIPAPRDEAGNAFYEVHQAYVL